MSTKFHFHLSNANNEIDHRKKLADVDCHSHSFNLLSLVQKLFHDDKPFVNKKKIVAPHLQIIDDMILHNISGLVFLP